MFEQTFVDGVGKTKKPYTIFISFIIQACLVGVMIIIPLIYYEALPGAQLSSFLSAPPPPPPPAPVSEKVTFAADAFFDTGKSAIKPEAKAKLSDLVDKTKGIALEVIIAVGHADSTGGDALNQKLSIARAEAVKKVLVEKGIEKNRVYTEGKGSKAPVADNKTAEGRAKNRRVEVEVVGTRTVK